MTKIAIFASGTGSNAQAIIDYFVGIEQISVDLIVSNRKAAGVFEKADQAGIRKAYFRKSDFEEDQGVSSLLKGREIDLIILAGFLLKIPKYLIDLYPDRIINIHPALLPKYGGKGMYGIHVHEAVFNNKESESGITIHLVNEQYDEGKILFQASVELEKKDSPTAIGKKVLELEHYYYPRVIEAFIENAI